MSADFAALVSATAFVAAKGLARRRRHGTNPCSVLFKLDSAGNIYLSPMSQNARARERQKAPPRSLTRLLSVRE